MYKTTWRYTPLGAIWQFLSVYTLWIVQTSQNGLLQQHERGMSKHNVGGLHLDARCVGIVVNTDHLAQVSAVGPNLDSHPCTLLWRQE